MDCPPSYHLQPNSFIQRFILGFLFVSVLATYLSFMFDTNVYYNRYVPLIVLVFGIMFYYNISCVTTTNVCTNFGYVSTFLPLVLFFIYSIHTFFKQ